MSQSVSQPTLTFKTFSFEALSQLNIVKHPRKRVNITQNE